MNRPKVGPALPAAGDDASQRCSPTARSVADVVRTLQDIMSAPRPATSDDLSRFVAQPSVERRSAAATIPMRGQSESTAISRLILAFILLIGFLY